MPGAAIADRAASKGEPMIKTILVPATGSDADNPVFASALAVARPFAAHLDFLHVRIDAASVAVTMSSEGGGSVMVGGLVDRLDDEAALREERARRIFDEFCAREGLAITDMPPGPDAPSAQWLRQVGLEPFWITEHGRAADLIVIGRSGDGEGVAPETIETALLDSGRPVLIPPLLPMTALPETVVIAWKATREAAHAVTAALPLLALARDIHILTVAEEEDLSSEEGGELMRNLRWRGLRVSAERLQPEERSPADTLIAAAAQRQALLVMGGYGHSRLREWVFGGFTRHVLQAAGAVPVLIVH
jgi:nucleotide-binding universal stress UspA family protein